MEHAGGVIYAKSAGLDKGSSFCFSMEMAPGPIDEQMRVSPKSRKAFSDDITRTQKQLLIEPNPPCNDEFAMQKLQEV